MSTFRYVVLVFGLNITLWADFSIDAFRSKLLTSAVSMYFESKGYGKVENATVDTVKKTLHFTLMPEGETQKLIIDIGNYSVKKIDGEEKLVLQNIKTNRIWLTKIFADHMNEGIRVPMGPGTKGAGALLLDF